MTKEELIYCFQDTVNFSLEGKLKRKTLKAIQSSKVYYENFNAPKRRMNKGIGEIVIEESTSFASAKKRNGIGKVCVLNFANPQNPGGGVANGAMAQEECLCRSSNLFLCLKSDGLFYDYYRYHCEMNNYYFSDRLIYTKNVTVFKDEEVIPRLMNDKEWFSVDVISCAAPFLGNCKYIDINAIHALFKSRIRNIFEAAIDNKVDVLILGAFGCGAFKNPPDVVAKAFCEIISEYDYQQYFKQIVFAIKSTTKNNTLEPCPNILAFESAFSGIAMYPANNIRIMTSEAAKQNGTVYFPQTQATGSIGSIELPSGRVLKGEKEINSYYRWKEQNKYRGKYFSILGDSISTLAGYNPCGYKVFYSGENCRKSNVEELSDTWWGQVLQFFDAQLLVNNSWSGSRVTKLPNTGELFPSGCSDERTSSLHIHSINPDVIIIYLGTNDWAFGAQPCDETYVSCAESELFEDAYDIMLQKIKWNYPNSEIWCCTLSETFMSSNPNFYFPHSYAGIHIEVYNNIIRNKAIKNNCKLIEIYNMKTPYDSIDGTHPNFNGMKTIATSVIYSMADEMGRNLLGMNGDDNNSYHMMAEDVKVVNKKEQIHMIEQINTEEDNLVGKWIGDRYQLQLIIGNSGMEKVYLATDVYCKKFAIKSFYKKGNTNRLLLDNFLNEVNIRKRISYPYFPKVVNQIENETHIFLVMEYVEGLNLKTIASNAGGILPVGKVLRYVLQIAEALQYLHSLNPPIINRNIKPYNILIDIDDNVKLVDFHIAMEYWMGRNDIWIVGTPGYVPPEQYTGMTTPKSDIFALGIVMHELLTGVKPPNSPYNIKPIRQYNPNYSVGLNQIVEKCIRANPAERYASCSELIVDIKKECLEAY